MEKIISVLNQTSEINNAYDLTNEQIEDLQKNIFDAKVCIPIIGKFSSGKSALVNTLLGYSRELLKRDITPETAIPTELLYSDEEEIVIIENNDGTIEKMPIENYRNYEADASSVKCARLYLKNSFLEKIPDVMLVDMPGFESGFEIHNKAIDNYLPNSLAYIVAVPADDMIIRSSVGNILKELCLHDMPICVVITKYDKKNDEFEETFNKMKESLKRYVGEREITYCFTSWFSGDAEELEECLETIQKKSQDILSHSFAPAVRTVIENTENYLKTTLENSELSESELAVKEESLKKDLDTIQSKFSSEKSNFDLELKNCVEEIKKDVQCALEAEESTIVAMALNNQDPNEHLNNVIRSTITVSVQNRFISKVEKYIKRVSEYVNSDDIGDINVPVNISMEKLNKTITNSIVTVCAGFIFGLIPAIFTGILLKIRSNKKKEEKRQQIKSELRNSVYPRIITEVGHKVNQEIARITVAINSSIENDFKNHKETLEKAMADLRNQINEENKRKKNLAADIKNDLSVLKTLKESLN